MDMELLHIIIPSTSKDIGKTANNMAKVLLKMMVNAAKAFGKTEIESND